MINIIKTKHKILAFLLALVMVIGIIPFTATEAHAMTIDAENGSIAWENGDSFTLYLVNKDDPSKTETHTVAYDGTAWNYPKSSILPAYAFAYTGEVKDITYTDGNWSYTPVLQLDQSSAEMLANADVMIATGEASKEDSLNLNFEHYYTKVTFNVELASEFNPGADAISRFDAVTCDGDYVNPYVDGNSYTAVIPANPCFKAGVDFALVTINGNLLEVEIPDEYANPNGSFVAGAHYTFDLKVGKDKVEIETVTVNGEFPGGWNDEVNLDGTTDTIGTPDAGKSAWETGDFIVVDFTSDKYGNALRGVGYRNNVWTWTFNFADLSYLENETPTVNAIYSPYYTISGIGDVVAGSLDGYGGVRKGECEFIKVGCSLSDSKTITVDFSQAKRDYSRLRIAATPNQTLRVTVNNFLPAGSDTEIANGFYQLVADDNGNAFLYGTFAEDGKVEVYDGDTYIEGSGYAKLAEYTFEKATDEGQSYVLDAHTHNYNENGICGICGERVITTITFDTDGGTAVAPITQECGTAVTAPANPTKTGYTFIGWSPSLPTTMPVEDISVKAMWQAAGHTIVWKNWNGTVLRTDYNVAKGTVPSYDNPPVKNHDDQYAYEFIGWTPAVTAVTGDATYTATFKAVPLSEYEYKVGDRVTASAPTVKYCPTCSRLLKNYTATITGVRGALDGKTVYWVTYECCGHKTSIIETEIIGLA